MEFGDEYDQFLLQKKKQAKLDKQFSYRFKNNKIFRYSIIGMAIIVIIILIFLLISIFTRKGPAAGEDKYYYVYESPIEIDDALYSEKYMGIYDESGTSRSNIAKIIMDYYDLAVINTDLRNASNELAREIKSLYVPQYATSLNSIFVKSNGQRIRTVSSSNHDCIIDPSTNKCYTILNKYIYDKFLLLENKETVFNDIVNFQATIHNTYYLGNKNTGGSSYKIPLRSTRQFNTHNMMTYYLEYRQIESNETSEINQELKFYEQILRYLFDEYDNLIATIIKKVTINGEKDDMINYTGNNYIKHISLKPLIKDNKLAYIDIRIDFVPKSVESKYTKMVRDSENWKSSGIATANMSLEDLWKALFRGEEYGFYPYQVDLINYTHIDYTNIIRNQTTFYNPVNDMKPKDEETTITYNFKNPVIIYENITRYNITENPDVLDKIAKNTAKAYEIRSKDIFATEILSGGYLDYYWDYVYNDAKNILGIADEYAIKGFAIGIQVVAVVKNSAGVVLGSHVIPGSEIKIYSDEVKLL